MSVPTALAPPPSPLSHLPLTHTAVPPHHLYQHYSAPSGDLIRQKKCGYDFPLDCHLNSDLHRIFHSSATCYLTICFFPPNTNDLEIQSLAFCYWQKNEDQSLPLVTSHILSARVLQGRQLGRGFLLELHEKCMCHILSVPSFVFPAAPQR